MCDSVVFRSDERRFLLAALAFVHTCSQGRHGFANSVAAAEISHEMTGSVSRSADAHCGTSQHVRPQAQRTFPGGVAAAARRVRRRTSGAAGRSGGCPVMTHRPRSVCRASGYRGFERRCFLFPTPSGATQEAASYTCPCAITRAGRANRGRAGSPALRAADRPRHVRTGADSASGGPVAPAVPVGTPIWTSCGAVWTVGGVATGTECSSVAEVGLQQPPSPPLWAPASSKRPAPPQTPVSGRVSSTREAMSWSPALQLPLIGLTGRLLPSQGRHSGPQACRGRGVRNPIPTTSSPQEVRNGSEQTHKGPSCQTQPTQRFRRSGAWGTSGSMTRMTRCSPRRIGRLIHSSASELR